jgi:hypothetical protein
MAPHVHPIEVKPLSNPQDEGWIPQGRFAVSFAAQIADLEIGGTATRARLIDGALTAYEIRSRMARWKESMRNNVAPSVRDVASRTGKEFVIEIAELVTPIGQWFLIALVSRTS